MLLRSSLQPHASRMPQQPPHAAAAPRPALAQQRPQQQPPQVCAAASTAADAAAAAAEAAVVVDRTLNPLVAGLSVSKTMALTDLASSMREQGIDVSDTRRVLRWAVRRRCAVGRRCA